MNRRPVQAHTHRVDPFGGPHGTAHVHERATSLDEAEEIISRYYLPNRLHLPRSAHMEMELSGLRIGGIMAGRLSYGGHVVQRTAEANDFHVNMAVRGHAISRSGRSEAERTGAGQGLVFSPEEHAEITWSEDCVQLCLMIPRAGLEAELERLLGRPVRSRLRFDFGVPPHGLGQLRTVLEVVARELDQPSGLATSSVSGRHLEGLVLDTLLLGQPHNYSEAAIGTGGTVPGGAVKRAVELMEEQPAESWTTVGLAARLHLSVRALQAGFKRDLGMPPMAYLRLVRLRRAHALLRHAVPGETSVRTVASSLGLEHHGRFAATYRAMFGETPSETLRR